MLGKTRTCVIGASSWRKKQWSRVVPTFERDRVAKLHAFAGEWGRTPAVDVERGDPVGGARASRRVIFVLRWGWLARNQKSVAM